MTVAGSIALSISLSFERILNVTGTNSFVVVESFSATGGSFTGVTVITATIVSHFDGTLLSQTIIRTRSIPLKSGVGTYVKHKPVGVVVPWFVKLVAEVIETVCASGSETVKHLFINGVSSGVEY